MENFFKETLRTVGVNLSKITQRSKIEDFLKKCYPVTTDIPLIRVGGNSDGGYLIPDDLDGIEACFSPGVADTATFELEMANRGIKSFLADYSVDGPPVQNALFTFEKKFLGTENNEKFMRLESWIKKDNEDVNADYILQMDIEGDEYDIIIDCRDAVLTQFRILIVEFHGLHFLSDPFAYKIINAAFRKLLKDFEILHIHPNNISKPVKIRGFEIPPTMEFTFLRKDRIKKAAHTNLFPHSLDFTCIPGKQDFVLPQCWHV